VDADEAKSFGKTGDKFFTPAGLELKEEAKAQVDYCSYMAKLAKRMPDKTFKAIGEDAAPGMVTLFENLAEACKKNPNFQSSLVVAMLKAAAAKELHGNNAATEEKVVNFFRFIQTYDAKAAQVLSANLSGPSARWMKKLNARDRDACILECGEDNEKVSSWMGEAIDCRKPKDGGSPPFHLAMDATKVPQVLEASYGHKAIIGGEYPNHLIDIDGKSKEEVRAILDGKSKEHGKISPVTEVKVCVMTFQNSPPGVSLMEVVAARPQSNN